MDRSRGMNTAPKVQVRRQINKQKKYKNERHHTYATFLIRNVRHVSHLTGKSNVTNRVHASGVTSNTVKKKRGNRAQKPRFSEAANTK